MPMTDAVSFERPLTPDHQEGQGAIAVIAAACRMPGAPEPDAFWQRIVEGQDCIRPFTPEEMAEAGIDAATAARPDYVGEAAMLEEAFDFDPAFFGYSDQEALEIDPQQRLFLACAAEALQMAGHAEPARRAVGVFGATRMSTWLRVNQEMLLGIAAPRNFQALTGNDKDYLATRVAYKLDLSGPALTVQTACSSSLVAIHMACEHLREGACDMALAGGVGITLPQALGYFHREGMIFSRDGHCRPFAADADGTGIGHGCGVVLLKRLEDAQADGDEIWAVVRGSAINNDGAAKAGFTAPGPEGQAAVIAEALHMAGVDPSGIGLMEAHGTGTPLGDPIEVGALTRVWRNYTQARQYCALGSVKSNLGHLDTAAGIASFLKVVMALRHRALPPTLHAETPNPALELEVSPFFLPAYALPWEATEPRRAAVSSFGIGGTNCHMILEEAPLRPREAAGSGPVATTVPGRGPDGLARYARRLAASRAAGRDGAADLATSLVQAFGSAGGARWPWRAVLTAPRPAAFRAALRTLAAGAAPVLLLRGDAPVGPCLTGTTQAAAASWLRSAAEAEPFGLRDLVAEVGPPPALEQWLGADAEDAALPPSGLLLPQIALARWLLAQPGIEPEGEGGGQLPLALARAGLAGPALAALLAALDRGEAPASTGLAALDALLADGAGAALPSPADPAWPETSGDRACLRVHLAEPDPAAFAAGLRLALWMAGLVAEAPPSSARRVSLPPVPFENRCLTRPHRWAAAASGASGGDWADVLATGAAASAAFTVDPDRARLEREGVAALHRHYVARALEKLGCFDGREPRDLDAAMAAGGIQPRFRQLTGRLLDDLVAEGGLGRDGAGRFVGLAPAGEPPGLLAPDGTPLMAPSLAALIGRTAPHLAEVLTGELPALGLVFPNGDTSDAASLYESHHDSSRLNDLAGQLAGAVARLSDRALTVLEVGAGTGGTTSAVLDALGERIERYVFTDIGPLFLARARERFASVGAMEYRQLDMEKDVLAQGFAAGSCDLLVAANVLHNAATLPGVLRNLARLLRPGGVLLLRELVERKPLFDLFLGALAPEVEDEAARGGLFAPVPAWRDAARDAGFQEVAAFPQEGSAAAAAMGEAIILARLPGEGRNVATDVTTSGPPPLWRGPAGEGPGELLGSLAEAALAAGLLPGALNGLRLAPVPAGTPLTGRLEADGSGLSLEAEGRRVAQARVVPAASSPDAAEDAPAAAPAGLVAGIAALSAMLDAAPDRLDLLALPGTAGAGLGRLVDGRPALVGGAGYPLLWLTPSAGRRLLPLQPLAEEAGRLFAERWEAVSAASPATAEEPLWLFGRRGAPLTEALQEAALREGREVTLLDIPADRSLRLPERGQVLVLATDLVAEDGEPADRLQPLHAALHGLARALRQGGEACRVQLVTRRALTLPGDATEAQGPLLSASALSALALGTGLSLAREMPHRRIALLDTDLSPASLALLLAGAGVEDGPAPAAALRRGQMLRRRHAALPADAAMGWSLPEGCVVLTGGLSRLGRLLVDWLGGQGVRDIALLLHREPRSDEAAALAAAETTHGVTIHVVPDVDCTSRDSVAAGFAALADRGLRPAAVFHLAGIVRDGLVERQDWSEVGAVHAVKLNAAEAILEALRPFPEARMVVFSSLAAALGPQGEGAHAGVNAALEALAAVARAQGTRATAVAWDHWREALRQEHQALADRFLTRGLDNAAGLSALGRALAWPAALLVAADPGAAALLNGEAADAAAGTSVEDQQAVAAGDPGDLLAWLRQALARLVGRPAEEIDPRLGLIQLGVDSLMFLDLGERMSRELGIALPAETALGADSLEELAGLLRDGREAA